MRNVVFIYLDSWWLPTAALILAVLFFVMSLSTFGLIASTLIIALAIVGILSASIWNFYRKKWIRGVLNLLIFCMTALMPTLIIICCFSNPISLSSNGDEFAEKLTIPQNMTIFEPEAVPENIDNRSEKLSDQVKHGKPSFTLYKSFQSGKYLAEIWVNPGEPGIIYLKAFEVTQKTPLSVDSLKEKSTKSVEWSENPNELFYTGTRFTIYEGDWGNPYAATFQVWFKPKNNKRSRKLIEKTYKIEGWQR